MFDLRALWVFLLLIPCVLVIDMLWVGTVMKNLYLQDVGSILQRSGESIAPRWIPALFVYLMIPAGLVLFVRPIVMQSLTLPVTFAWGAAFGFILYGVFAMTNLAILEKWTVRLAFADLAWGAVLCGLSSVILQFIERWLAKEGA